MHERVCHHLEGQSSFAFLRRWLGQQHVDGKRMKLVHMGRNKADFVLSFIRIVAQDGRSTVLSGVSRPVCSSVVWGVHFSVDSSSCAPRVPSVASGRATRHPGVFDPKKAACGWKRPDR